MNNIITIDQFASILSQQASISIEEAREYLKLFQIGILTGLKNDGEVEIPYLGTFSCKDGKVNLVLLPDNASILNEPFDSFEPIKLSPDYDDVNISNDVKITDGLIPDNAVAQAHEITPTPKQSDDTVEPAYTVKPDDTMEPDGIMESDDVADDLSEDVNTINNGETPDPMTENVDVVIEEENNNKTAIVDDIQTENESPDILRNAIYFISGLLTGMVLTCIAVYFLYPPINHYDEAVAILDSEGVLDENIVSDSALVKDNSIQLQDIVNKPEPVITDTVTSTYFLASMARKYYGRMEYWVYIYKENEDILGHPDRISTGTIVKIPDLKSRGIELGSDESIGQAQSLAQEIYEKWK